MKALRAEGWSYDKIAKKFNVARSTVLYHITDYGKPQAIVRAKRSNKKQKENGYYQRPEVKARRKAYIRDYLRQRYQKDPDFRRKMIRANSGGKFAE